MRPRGPMKADASQPVPPTTIAPHSAHPPCPGIPGPHSDASHNPRATTNRRIRNPVMRLCFHIRGRFEILGCRTYAQPLAATPPLGLCIRYRCCGLHAAAGFDWIVVTASLTVGQRGPAGPVLRVETT